MNRPHNHAVQHVTGEALYVDDIPLPPGTLHAVPVVSPHAHARLIRLHLEDAKSSCDVVAVLTATDIPGNNHIGPVVHDEEALASVEVHAVGQPIALVVARSRAAALAARALVKVDWEVLPAIEFEAGIASAAFYGAPHVIQRGDVATALASSPHRLSATTSTGGQDHFYLETHAALVVPGEAGAMSVWSSTQHPTEVQTLVASALGIQRAAVEVIVPRMGGGFGGKETQAAPWAVLAAVAAHYTHRPVKCVLDREQDMTMTGGRHPFRARWEVGFTETGQLTALDVTLWADAGASMDLSLAIVDRALFHLDNTFYIPILRFQGHAVRTNRLSNTAFRGFGGPQGAFVIEQVMEQIAHALMLNPDDVRRRNLYRTGADTTPYGQRVEDPRAERMWDALTLSAELRRRTEDIRAYNASSPSKRRALAVTGVKFGISFTTAFLNQAGAYVRLYADGSVSVDHGGTEMGQGLVNKVAQIASRTLGVPYESIRQSATSTDRVPNTSATAASSGADLNGAAVQAACSELVARLMPVADSILGGAAEFGWNGHSWARRGGRELGFGDVCREAWLRRIPLAATGFFATPGIAYDRIAGHGTPFHYYAWGVAATEVELDGLTGAFSLRRVDILHDVGDSLANDIDIGQIEGAYLQGVGWLTIEEIVHDAHGAIRTVGPSTYKVPGVGETPRDFRVSLLENATQPGTVGGSKAVGEPPFLLAIGAHVALQRAVAAFGSFVPLPAPATRETLVRAISRATTRGP